MQERTLDMLLEVGERVERAKAEASAATRAGMRSAEEIAREMVREPEEGAPDEWRFRITCGNAWTYSLAYDRQFAQADSESMRNELTRLIEQSRADGAAAEREHATISLCPAPDVPGQWVAHHVRRDLVTQGDSEPHALRMLAEAIEMADGEAAAHPPDLAGRIRALVQEYAGRWADARSEARADAIAEAMRTLWHVLREAEASGDVPARKTNRLVNWEGDGILAEEMRGLGSRIATIVRECGEGR